jgi:hypothetical protein
VLTGLIEQAINGDKHALRLLFENLQGSVSALNQTVGIVGADTQSQTPQNPIPKPAQMRITNSINNLHSVSITNPQFLRTTTPAKVRGNLARSQMVHVLSYSTDPTFRNNVTTLPPGTQTHYQIPSAKGGTYFRVQSSVDGQNYNKVQQTGPYV